jgi:single-strand DNA-binding protein
MSNNVNKYICIGYLTADPVFRTTHSGGQIATFRIAINESWRTRQGEPQQLTTFLQVAVWGKPAERVAEFYRKGALVYVEGKIRQTKYENKSGHSVTSFEIRSDMVRLLCPPRGGDNE